MRFRKRILNPALFFLNILASLGFALALLAPFVPPNFMSIFAFAATGFPVLILLNLLFLVWWLIQWNRRILLPVLTLAAGYFAVGRTYRFGDTYQVIPDKDKISLMSYNVRSFNRYQWLDETDIPEKINALIEKEQPDIIFFQEYFHSDQLELPSYPHRFFGDHDNGSSSGLAIFSRIPLSGSARIYLDEKNRSYNLLKTHISWQGREWVLYNVHLASVGLEQPDYQALESPDYEEGENLKSGLKNIVRRLHYAYRRRTGQAEELRRHLERDTSLVILGGDFNDVPQSYPYHLVNNRLLDSFIEGGGHGFGHTYARGPLPLRIDYLWHSTDLRSRNYRVVREELSDHYPLMADFMPAGSGGI
jgi:endonuclease/exonuclease/phosphatase (EEP) superfamily protein YafD